MTKSEAKRGRRRQNRSVKTCWMLVAKHHGNRQRYWPDEVEIRLRVDERLLPKLKLLPYCGVCGELWNNHTDAEQNTCSDAFPVPHVAAEKPALAAAPEEQEAPAAIEFCARCGRPTWRTIFVHGDDDTEFCSTGSPTGEDPEDRAKCDRLAEQRKASTPAALPEEVVCDRYSNPHQPDSHVDHHGAECVTPRPAPPDLVVCRWLALGHGMQPHIKNTVCKDPRPAHPPAARVEQKQLGEEGVKAITESTIGPDPHTPDTRPTLQPCGHGRADYRGCPHCMGFNQRYPSDGELPTFTVSYSVGQIIPPTDPRFSAILTRDRQWTEALDGVCNDCLRRAARWPVELLQGEEWTDCEHCGTALRDLVRGEEPPSTALPAAPVSAAPVGVCEKWNAVRPNLMGSARRCGLPLPCAKHPAAPVEPARGQHDPPGSCAFTSSGVCVNHPAPHAPSATPEPGRPRPDLGVCWCGALAVIGYRNVVTAPGGGDLRFGRCAAHPVEPKAGQ